MKLHGALAAVFALGLLALASPASAENFKSVSQCVPGKRVVADDGQKGRIVSVVEGVLCNVRLDSDGRERVSIFWMLHDEGGSAETNDKLVRGAYQCFAGNPNRYTFMNLTITGPARYQWAGKSGGFHIGAANRIIYDSGPLKGYGSKLMAGPSVGLNSDGGSFFGTVCSLKR